jgi:3-oxoacyl-[acyl-carrier-protein] synthase III
MPLPNASIFQLKKSSATLPTTATPLLLQYPLALDEAVRQGKIQAGDIIAASGFGAGLTWGATIFQWGR